MAEVAAPLRRLPIPLPPVAGETLPSYLGRLAAANHLDFQDLQDIVSTGKRNPLYGKRSVDITRLAAVTGLGAGQLEHALPDLHPQPNRRRAQPPRPACPRCVRRHRGGPVKLYLSEHRHVCVRHNTWLGSLGPFNNAWVNPEGPIDVSSLPAIRTAQLRHHRLVRHHGESAATDAVGTAVEIWGRMHHPNFLGDHDWHRIRTLRPGADRISPHDPLAHAVRYPEVVAITSVIISPTWQAQAASWHTRNQAFDEIGRRVGRDGYDWRPGARHPLTYWANGCEQQRREQQRKEANHSARTRSTETGNPAWSQ